MTWNAAAQWGGVSDYGAWVNVTYRLVIEPSAVLLSGTKLRITLESSDGGRLYLSDCFVGKTVAGGAKPSFAVNPTRVTFNSGDNFAEVEGQLVSDEITFSFDPADGDALTFSFYIPARTSSEPTEQTVRKRGVTGTNLFYVTSNYAGANNTQLNATNLIEHPGADVLSIVKVEFDGGTSDTSVTSSLSLDWNIQSSAASVADISKFSIYSIIEVRDEVDISKFSIYGIFDAGTTADVSKASMYVIVTDEVLSVLTAQWNINGVEVISNLDFKWNIQSQDITSSCTFLWNDAAALVPFIRNLQLRWNVLGPITSECRFRWNDLDGTPAMRSLDLLWNVYNDPVPVDYIVSGVTFEWNISQGYVDPSRIIYPDVPILETWTFKTSVFRSRSGREQRRSYYPNPVVSLQYSALILDDKGFKDLRQAVEIDTTAFYQVPQFQYYDYARADANSLDTRLYFDPAEVNPIVGSFVAICDDTTGETVFRLVEEVHADGCTLQSIIGINVIAGLHFICPVRVSRISTDGNAKLYPVHANATYIFVSVDRDVEFLRDDVTPGFTMLGGYIVLDLPISADTDINEDYLSGNTVLDNGQAAPVLYVDEPTRRRFDLNYMINRLDGPAPLDWWRSFALATCGQWKAFLLPTYRADADLVAPPDLGDTEITVLGRATYDVFTAGGYFGLMFDTANGREYREVTGVVLDAGNTVCLLAEPIGGVTGDNDFADVSYLMLVRLAEDRITINHGKMTRLVQLKVQMTKE